MQVRDVASFVEYWERIRGRTRKVVQCIPPERFDWTYRDGKFTLADLVRHLAGIERYMYAENVRGLPSRYPGHGRELADGPEPVLRYFESTHAEALEIFRSLSDADLERPCVTPAGTPIATGKWLRAMVEHEVHHRGQIYLYLAMLDVPTPPLYGLTSEQVRERSRTRGTGQP